MYKKLIAVGIGVAALSAFAASTASAAPIATHPTGHIYCLCFVQFTNTGEVTMASSLGTIFCSRASMSGTLNTNSTASGSRATVTSATFSGTGTNGECTSWTGGVTVTPGVTGGLPWCLEATAASDEGKVRGGACSEASRSIKYALDFTSIGTCNYERATAAIGTLTTDTAGEAAKISLSKQVWTGVSGNPFGCPSSGELNMTFDLETSVGSPEPIYFSS
jgi:hypothetical protein